MASPKILLIEDQKMAQAAAVAVLETLNCPIDVANSGKEAIELCERNKYALVLLDLGLPDMNVMSIVKQIRLTQGKKVSIVAVTAYASKIIEKQCLEAGMKDFIQKPLTYEKVGLQLSQYIKKRFFFF